MEQDLDIHAKFLEEYLETEMGYPSKQHIDGGRNYKKFIFASGFAATVLGTGASVVAKSSFDLGFFAGLNFANQQALQDAANHPVEDEEEVTELQAVECD